MSKKAKEELKKKKAAQKESDAEHKAEGGDEEGSMIDESGKGKASADKVDDKKKEVHGEEGGLNETGGTIVEVRNSAMKPKGADAEKDSKFDVKSENFDHSVKLFNDKVVVEDANKKGTKETEEVVRAVVGIALAIKQIKRDGKFGAEDIPQLFKIYPLVQAAVVNIRDTVGEIKDLDQAEVQGLAAVALEGMEDTEKAKVYIKAAFDIISAVLSIVKL